MKHLDDSLLKAVLRGDEVSRTLVRAHLAESCETCEAFLAQAELPGLLEGEVDRVLVGNAAAPVEDPVAFGKVMRRMRVRRVRDVVAPIAGIAASVVLALMLLVPARPEMAVGVKGTSARLAVELSAVARAKDGSMRPLKRGDTVRNDELVLFRYHASEPAHAQLLQQTGGGGVEALAAFELEPGTHDLTHGDEVSGVELSGLEGQVTFWLAGAVGATLDAATVRRAVEGHGGDVAAAGFPLRVEREPSSSSP